METMKSLHANETQFGWAAIVLIVGLILSTAGLLMGLQEATHIAQADFARISAGVATQVDRRLRLPTYGLAGARGAVAALNRVPTNAEFRAYVESRDLPVEFPGVSGMGMIIKVDRNHLSEFQNSASLKDGEPFAVRNAGSNGDLYVIRAIEPLERNREALGLNVAFERSRRKAVERVYVEGVATATAPIRLVQDEQRRPGTLFLLPVFKHGGPSGDGKDDQVIAIVYAAITYAELLRGVLPESGRASKFVLHDVNAPSEDSVLFDSDPDSTYRPALEIQQHFEYGGRELRLDQMSSEIFDDDHQTWFVWLAAGLSFLISISLAALVMQLVSTRQRALQIAQSMTGHLSRLAAAVELSKDAILLLDNHGRIEWANPMFYECSTLDPLHIAGKRLVDHVVTDQTDIDAVRELRAALSLHKKWTGMVSARRKDGSDCMAMLDIQPIADKDGKPISFLAVMTTKD